MRKCLGIDPSTKGFWWCLIHEDAGGLDAVRHGKAERDDLRDPAWLLDLGVDLIAVERVSNYASRAVVTVPLLHTSYMAGMVTGTAWRLGIEVAEFTAKEIRELFNIRGTGRNQDAQVAGTLKMLLRSEPSRWNAHARDAALVAVAALSTSKLRPGNSTRASMEP